MGSRRSSNLTRLMGNTNGNSNVAEPNGESDNINGSKAKPIQASADPEGLPVLAEAARRHLRLLKLAVQRFGGWGRPTAGRQVHILTAKVWKELGSELKVKEEDALSTKWKVDGFGGGKAEAGLDEDGFKAPTSWTIY